MSVEKNSKSLARDQQRQAKLARHGAQNSKLGQALRTNLRLRKAQQRARQDMQTKPNRPLPDIVSIGNQDELGSAHQQNVHGEPPDCLLDVKVETNAG